MARSLALRLSSWTHIIAPPASHHVSRVWHTSYHHHHARGERTIYKYRHFICSKCHVHPRQGEVDRWRSHEEGASCMFGPLDPNGTLRKHTRTTTIPHHSTRCAHEPRPPSWCPRFCIERCQKVSSHRPEPRKSRRLVATVVVTHRRWLVIPRRFAIATTVVATARASKQPPRARTSRARPHVRHPVARMRSTIQAGC